MDRWQMNRAGILNFWYYDEEEFLFEQGRLILRGTNGSGKSVTMQSFIPLVLDGDKRPERLDPFGSRDRRLEYYLLGDTNQGHTDRTGYLWLEFYHPEKKLFKTIGIGVRARRGVPQLGFWGFLLDDSRRVGKDFYLYDRNLWLEDGKKLPLHRKALEEKIASGGQVVQEQSVYREMVNKALFGFRETESYKDLLKLLLELRSPKLSKDLKPSSIYEILNKSLPPLMEDDLSSLSEVLEDMDQITDRLDELQLHVRELSHLEQIYNNYNQFLLHQASNEVVQQWKVYNKNSSQLKRIEEQLIEIAAEKNIIVQKLIDCEHRLGIVEVELEVLIQGEAMGKQRELEIQEEQLAGIHKQIQSVSERITSNQIKLEQLEQEISSLAELLSQIVNEQNKTISELEDMARMIEFNEHDVYHGIWGRGVPEENQWHNNWVKDLDAHKKRLVAAQQTAREEGEAARAAKEMEIQLGEILQQRHQAEEEQHEQKEKLETIKEYIREELVAWYQRLQHLPAQGEHLRESLRALTLININNRLYDPVRQPVVQAYEQQKESYMQQIAVLNQKKEGVQNEHLKLEQELHEWKMAKEPEPQRTESRNFSRQERKAGTGAPLYTVCDFSETLSESQQAQLEETLYQAGLLDAWILPGGQVGIFEQHNKEEVWFQIQPSSLDKGKTLSSVLHAIPSEKSGLSVEDINGVLNCIGYKEESDSFTSCSGAFGALITKTGNFSIGPLSGKNNSKRRAEFIGAANRLHTKQLEITKLEEKIQLLNEQLENIDQQLHVLSINQQNMVLEINAFPHDIELQNQLELVLKATIRLEHSMEQEQKVEGRYKIKVSDWRAVQVKLMEQTADWSRLKNEPQINEAIEYCSTYQGYISDLHSQWGQYHSTLKIKANQTNQYTSLLISVEDDQTDLEELEIHKVKLTAQVNVLSEIVKAMGIEDIHRRITDHKNEKGLLSIEISKLQEQKEQQNIQLGKAEGNLENCNEKVNDSQELLNNSLEKWRKEIRLGLLPLSRKLIEPITNGVSLEDVVTYCEQVAKEDTKFFANVTQERIGHELTREFHKSKANLQEYAIDLDFGEASASRAIILSKRDRLNPVSPTILLNELTQQMEEHQILLTAKDRELYEEIIIGSVGKAIRRRIHRAKAWVEQMDELMKQRNTSSGLKLSLKWLPLSRNNEDELDTETLVSLLMRDQHRMDDEQIEQVITHFRTRILQAKQDSQREDGVLRSYIYSQLDYRSWFEFKLEHIKGDRTTYTELCDHKFNVLSGGEKAMAMYIPLFAATYSRYSEANLDAPKIISLDEAFAGVDDANMRDMFHLLTDMGFDYIMTSQVLWGCYDTVPSLAIYEIYRPKDTDFVTLFHYRWDGESKVLVN
ncbi:TIGR02680 family protein [Paenibacillus sp. 481]|uniref:TIGR02680 family protein n=1 Tax=Paenibacillus sp. 481 TaxID=2835869 RepID=UPI001E5FC660|nr:TIGR02680 family protein [Paenibacillus sp. 481]UHA72766.1 TIGR02680 family protein [Paenibacillus sp. 481]